MSFFSDPELYLVWGRQMGLKFYVFRVERKSVCPFMPGDFCDYEVLDFSKHLSLPHNKESDFESLFAYLRKNDKFVNCQGHVINWFSNDGCNSYSWSPEWLNLSSYGIHAPLNPQENESDAHKNGRARDEKLQALEKRVSGLHEQLSREKNGKLALEKRVSGLHEQVNQEKPHMQALERRVSDVHKQLNREKKNKQALEKRVLDLNKQLNDQEKDDKQALEERMSNLHEQLNQEKKEKKALEERVSGLQQQLNQGKNDEQALEVRESELRKQLDEEMKDQQGRLEKIVSRLQDQMKVNHEKNDMQALEKTVSGLHQQLKYVKALKSKKRNNP